MSNKQSSKHLIEQKNEKSKLVPPATNNPHNELKAIFDPPTELSIKCLLEDQRSFIEDRRWTGKRAAEIVEKKYSGYPKITNEQLSQSFKQVWDERVAVCQSLTAESTGNPEAKNTAETEATEKPEPTKNTAKKQA